MKINTILATKGMRVVTIRPQQSLKEAVNLLAQYNIGALVVVNDSGAPVGIISERDIVREAVHSENVFNLPVSAVMTEELVTGSPQDDLRSVLQTMTDRHFRHLPILDQGKLAGMISIGDVVKAQISAYQGEIETLETRVTQG
ncbi:MAG: CBS domain-containing protein [Chloroflexi bacterium]|nr:CBS domain-containing protein [Chloroflexota bacterium]